MPKQGQRAEINTFIQGLITEASPLNYPTNASLDEDNFELNRDGTRDRRLGMDFEPANAEIDTGEFDYSVSLESVNTFKWSSVNGLIDQDLVVVQVNKKLFFFDASVATISTTGYKGTITLSSLPTGVRFSFAALEGKLIVASGIPSIAVVSYNSTLGTFSVVYDRLKTRDVWGVEVTTSSYEADISFRGTTLPDSHVYNLQNQSWGIPRKNKAGTLVNPITQYNTDLSLYPSNSELVWAGLKFVPATGSTDPFERMYTNMYTEALGANVLASKGYFIIDVLDRGTSRQTAFAANKTKYATMTPSTVTLPTDSTSGGATCIESFAGRVFYAGFNGEVTGGDKRSPLLSDHIFFSGLVRSFKDIFRCHQEGDPTSRDSFDLLDSDGGFLRISGAQGIIALRSLQSNLVVFATNGVWLVSGGSDYGFSATNFKVNKVSNFGAVSITSIVTQNNQIYYWAEDAIYVVGSSEVGDIVSKSITDDSIKTFYEKITDKAKISSLGAYDQFTKKIRWLYKQYDLFTSTSLTRELILDLSLNAFYTSTISNSAGNVTEVMGVFISTAFSSSGGSDPVLVGTDLVYVDDAPVGVVSNIRKTATNSLRYLTLIKTEGFVSISFAYYQDSDFVDWFSVDSVGVDAKAYLLTGSQIAGDSAIDKQIPYLVMHFRRTESGTLDGIPDNQSSCKVRSQWNWANTIKSNKWGPQFQAYRYRVARFVEGESDDYDNGFETIVSKSKLRGRGKAFALYLETEPRKDCRILGWNLTINANALA